MRNPKIKGYSYKLRDRESYIRVVAEVPAADIKALDEWGISQGMPNRTAVIRQIIKDAVKEKALESRQASSNASNN